MLVAPAVLLVVLTLAVLGRGSRPTETVVPSADPRSAAIAAARPATIAGRGSSAGGPRRHEEGTDGLMGRLAFGLPNDTPLVPLEMANRFTIDDIRAAFSVYDSTPPWVRRLSVLGSYRADPYER